MTITIDGTNGITSPALTSQGAITGDGISFADNAPSNSLVVNSSGNVGIGTSSPAQKLDVVGLFFEGADSRTNNTNKLFGLRMPNYANATASVNLIGAVSYSNANQIFIGGNDTNFGGTAATSIQFYTAANSATASGTERARIDSSGNLLVGKTADNSANQGWIVYPSGTAQYAYNSAGTVDAYQFYRSNTKVGYISTTASATSYSTSSDYRLKENIQPMQNALDVVAQLNPVTYTWKADGSDGQGFIAHELQAVVPDCVTGEKDAVDADGNPVYQGIDTSFLVATLTKAIQEQQEQIEQMKQEIAALKGAA